MIAVAPGAAPSRERTASGDERSRQLDLFRGVAAILMIVNHAGYRLLGAAASAGSPGC